MLWIVILIPFAVAGEILSGFFPRRGNTASGSFRAKLVKRLADMQYEVMNTLPGDEDFPEEEPWPDEEAPESWSFDEAELEELPGDDVIAINEEFYRSLEALSLDRMEKVWHDAEWVTCVHPGGPMLTGWEVIRDSWEQIFKGT